jgi:citrate lyase beta subunit
VLVVPASEERKARKAISSEADEVVLDLEDAVVAERKPAARETAKALVAELGGHRPVSVRINAPGTQWASEDIAACAALGPALHSVVTPKAESANQIRALDRLLGDSPASIQALIETPTGVLAAADTCRSSPRLEAVIIGYADLAAALGRLPSAPPASWCVIQETVLLAARAAGLAVIDGPHLSTLDDKEFRAAKTRVSELGFDGTWVIHPRQIDTALTVFTPDPDTIADAHRVLAALDSAAAAGIGAVDLDGRMLDEALAASARRVLARDLA